MWTDSLKIVHQKNPEEQLGALKRLSQRQLELFQVLEDISQLI